eukprot:6016489-Ditylum_brightwellii.AAC.1
MSPNPANYKKLDTILQEELIPSLLDVDVVNKTFFPLFSLPVKFADTGVLCSSTEVSLNCVMSINSTLHLKEAILQNHPFNSQDHCKFMDNGRAEGEKRK